MTDQTIALLGIGIALISGIFGYIIKIWTTSTSDDVKATGKENQEQAIEITRLNGKLELLQAKLDTLQAKSDVIQEKLNKISDNELVHIKADMTDLKDKNNEGHQAILLAIQKLELTINNK